MTVAQMFGIDPVLDDRIIEPDGKVDSLPDISASLTDKRLDPELTRNERMEVIGTLASGIAHDLNNVLVPILMAVELLKDADLARRSKQLVEGIQSSAERGIALVGQILAFSRKGEMRFENVILADVVGDLMQSIAQIFPRNIEIEVNIPKDIWIIPSEPNLILQILLNLAVNARDAMPNGGRLKISAANEILSEDDPRLKDVAQAGRFVRISILDNGTGIPEEYRSNLFKPFFTTKGPGKGTGLGLTVVHELVKKHTGFVTLSSEVGNGTEFSIFLPALARAVSTKAKTTPQFTADAPRTILLVDDEATFHQIVGEALKEKGYSVLSAMDGREALKILQEGRHTIDLVLTDIVMPNLNGWDTIAAIKKMDPQKAIIAVSGHSNYLRSEFSDDVTFIQKPFSVKSLIEKIDLDFRRRAGPQ
jgi:two-component system, cell cycle sensor histidine kinase and response regulator CckA